MEVRRYGHERLVRYLRPLSVHQRRRGPRDARKRQVENGFSGWQMHRGEENYTKDNEREGGECTEIGSKAEQD